MRRIIGGTAYDTETGDFIVEVHEADEWVHRLYRTRNGAYFLYHAGSEPVFWDQPRNGDQPDTYKSVESITPLLNEEAAKWLERNANGLVERYFGEMPEAVAGWHLVRTPGGWYELLARRKVTPSPWPGS